MDEKFRWTEASVFDALGGVHPGPEAWTLIPHLPDGTSSNKCRTVDAMAFGCWRSEGIVVHGYEIKVSRSDWLHEIQQPEKSQGFQSRCNYWWVAAPEDIVRVEEMPANWGLRVVSRGEGGRYSSRVKKAATYNPDPIFELSFVVALARACWKMSPERRANDKLLKAEYDKGYELGQERIERDSVNEHLRRERDELKEAIATFEKASGIEIRHWNAGEVGKAVQAMQNLQNEHWHGLGTVMDSLSEMMKNAEELAKIIGFTREPKQLGTRRKKRR